MTNQQNKVSHRYNKVGLGQSIAAIEPKPNSGRQLSVEVKAVCPPIRAVHLHTLRDPTVVLVAHPQQVEIADFVGTGSLNLESISRTPLECPGRRIIQSLRIDLPQYPQPNPIRITKFVYIKLNQCNPLFD